MTQAEVNRVIRKARRVLAMQTGGRAMKRRATLPYKRRTASNPAKRLKRRRENIVRAQARARRRLGDMIAMHCYGEPDDLPLARSALRHFKATWWTEVVGLAAPPRTVGEAREVVRALRG